MVAGGGLREDEKKADRERERVAGGVARETAHGLAQAARGDGTRGVGWVAGWVPDDGVGDEVSRTWSRTRRARVYEE